MSRPKIFISHITKDAKLADYLKKQLSQDFLNFLDIFVSSDGLTLSAGTKWLDELNKSLTEAQIQLVLCSKDSVERPWVNFETGACWIRNILIIPICHSGMAPAELPTPLNMLQSVEASNVQGIKLLYETIAKQIGMNSPLIDYSVLVKKIKDIELECTQNSQLIRDRLKMAS